MIVYYIYFLVVLMMVSAKDQVISCLDNDNKPVDWFFTYKMPGGYQFAYIDSNDGPARTNKLQVFDRTLDDNDVALINTLRSLLPSVYQNQTSKTRTYAMYNDQPDNATPSASYGHAKGVIGIEEDGENSFWLLHSTPHFPAPSGSSKFYFPDGEIKFGQTFLCMSLGSGGLDKIANQLRYIHPYIYYSNVKSSTRKANPNLDSLLDKDFITDAGSNTMNFKVGSKTFKSFAKNSNWDSDLWEDLVAPGLDSGLIVETWMRGSEIGPCCKPKYKYDVVDVQTMDALSADGATKIEWTEGGDHSKWAVTTDDSNNVCVGDINRMTTQRDRGGGAVCFTNANMANTLYNSVTGSDSCK